MVWDIATWSLELSSETKGSNKSTQSLRPFLASIPYSASSLQCNARGGFSKCCFHWQVWLFEKVVGVNHVLLIKTIQTIPHTSAAVSHCGLIWLSATLLLTSLFWFLSSFSMDRDTQIRHFIYWGKEFPSNGLDSWMENSYQWNGSQLGFICVWSESETFLLSISCVCSAASANPSKLLYCKVSLLKSVIKLGNVRRQWMS